MINILNFVKFKLSLSSITKQSPKTIFFDYRPSSSYLMSKEPENIKEIGHSIKDHVSKETFNGYSNRAFGRAHCNLVSTSKYLRSQNKVFWLTNHEDLSGITIRRDFSGTGAVINQGRQTTLRELGHQAVYKNSLLGEKLTRYNYGVCEYYVGRDTITLEIFNKATYQPQGSNAKEIDIWIGKDGSHFRFQKLADLLKAIEKEEEDLVERQKEIVRMEEERKRLEEELRRQQEEAEAIRIEKEKKEKEEQLRRNREEIQRIEESLRKKREEENTVRAFIRSGIMLRSQHLLDNSQEDAKRSHIYDGVPIIIDGGPGTGKTTTVIQRLRFLLSRTALSEYDNPLKDEQIIDLTEPTNLNNKWLFFSPTELLLQYLRNNMREEGLNANDENTRIIAKFRKKMMRDYELFNPSKEGPFKDFTPNNNERVLIKDGEAAITAFAQYFIDYYKKIFEQRVAINTASHPWHADAVKIKSTLSKVSSVKDLEALIKLFNSLQDNEEKEVKEWGKALGEDLKEAAITLVNLIKEDEEKVKQLTTIFERWKRERLKIDEDDEEENEIIEEDEVEPEVSLSKQDFDQILYNTTKSLIKQLGVKLNDSKSKISKRNQEIYEVIKDLIDEDELGLRHIGSVAYFMRNYASLCKGLGVNILNALPKIYKQFRRSIEESSIYRVALLHKIMQKDQNKHLHPDEQNLILGFINTVFYNVYTRSRIRFDKLKHKYLEAYKANVRHVIGIDEATDYSILDYYFMTSFRHYEFSSITLCGDIMQGLNSNGIRSWNQLKVIEPLKNLEVKTLNISYRQLPTLLNLAKELYKEEQGEYPSYNSFTEQQDTEPKPLLMVSDDEEEKAVWICERIRDIYDTYNELPSVAIFVGDDVNIKEFIDRINDLDLINGIEVVDCSGDKQLQNKEMVRVFRLSEVKGMEFEAAFFYDIDKAIQSSSIDMMRRYLYVGISRATSHLAATMTEEMDDESISMLFEREDTTWQI